MIRQLNCRQCAAGSALISALFIMTLVAIAATAMSMRLQLDIYRTHLTLLSDKLYLASQGVTFWAMGELSDKKTRFMLGNAKGKVRDFPSALQTIYPGFTLKGELYDLQARFNLNNLNDKKYYPVFLKLLEHVLPAMPKSSRETIAMASSRWITPYSPGHGNDELMRYYAKQIPAYHPSQYPFQTLSEFRLIRGVDANTYQSLKNYLSVLPAATPINVNSASTEVLLSLAKGITEAQLNEFLQTRGDKGFHDQKKLTPLLQKLHIREELVTIESQYFMSIAFVNSNDDLSMINIAIIRRTKDNQGKYSMSILSESLNTW